MVLVGDHLVVKRVGVSAGFMFSLVGAHVFPSFDLSALAFRPMVSHSSGARTSGTIGPCTTPCMFSLLGVHAACFPSWGFMLLVLPRTEALKQNIVFVSLKRSLTRN